jgi:hypothetical protein
MNLENGGGGQAFSLQAGLEAFHLLGGEPVKTDTPPHDLIMKASLRR